MAKVYASTIIKKAIGEIGYHEKKSNSQLDSKTANSGSNNFTKYARDIWEKAKNILNGNKQGVEWCAVFCIWLFVICFGAAIAQKVLFLPNKSAAAGANYFMNYFKAKKRFYSSPKAGDMIFFGANKKARHVGLVEYVTKTEVHTIEGNSSNQVRRRVYKLIDKDILGYGRPDYDAEPSPELTPTPTPTPTEFQVGDKVKIVEGATWASGAKIPTWVMSSVLYVRQIRTDGNIAISVFETGAITGVIDPKYLVLVESAGYNARVINIKTYLNVRSGPGTNYSSVGKLYNGNLIHIDQEKGRWAHMTSDALSGWVSMDYIKKVD